MSNTIFNQLRTQGADSTKSVQWFQTQIAKLGTINTNKLLREGTLVNRIFPGEMYLFRYDPKTKEQLPYYDTLPLVLPFRRIEEGFIGINLHYLPYLYRVRTLDALSEYANGDANDADTRLRFSWRILESVANLKPARVCVKRYLLDHVESRFLKIPYPDWLIASQLPVEKFINAQKTNVWRETRKKFL